MMALRSSAGLCASAELGSEIIFFFLWYAIFKYDSSVTGFGFYNAFALVASLGFKNCDCDAFDSMSWPVDYERPTGILHGGVYFIRCIA